MNGDYCTELVRGTSAFLWGFVAVRLVVALWLPAAINAAIGCAISAVLVSALRLKLWWDVRP